MHERDLLAKWKHDKIGNSIAIGDSTRGAISHLKILIVDGVYTVRGSTNWSLAGEQKQDNELTVHRNAVVAAETRAELDLHAVRVRRDGRVLRDGLAPTDPRVTSPSGALRARRCGS